MATRTEVPALARERQQELVLATTAAHACESVLENPTSLELVDYLADDLAPVTPASREALIAYRANLAEMIFDEASSYTVQNSAK
jgi:hypothetical protein